MSIWSAIILGAMMPMIFMVAAVSENLTHQIWMDAAADAVAKAAAEAAVGAAGVRGDLSSVIADAGVLAAAQAVAARRAGLREWTGVNVELSTTGTGGEVRIRAAVSARYRSQVVFWAGNRPTAATGTARFVSAVGPGPAP